MVDDEDEFKKIREKLCIMNDIYNECATGKSDWICKSCYNSLSKNKMPMQVQINNLELCPKFNELDRLCSIESMLISQIIPFIFINDF